MRFINHHILKKHFLEIFYLLLFFLFFSMGCRGNKEKDLSLISLANAKVLKSGHKSIIKSSHKSVLLSKVVSSKSASNDTAVAKRVLVGTVKSNRKVVISPEAAGVIRKIYVKKGDYVKKRQILIRLNCKDYNMMVEQVKGQIAVAKAGIELAKIQSKNAAREYLRFSKLYQKHSIPTYQFDKVKIGKELAFSQVILAQKRLQVAFVGLRMARKRQRGCVTRAPFAGVVTHRLLDEGTIARMMPPSMVMVIEEIDPIVIEVSIGEMYIKELKKATLVKIVIPSLGKKPLYELSSDVLQKSLLPVINPYNRSATLRFSLSNKKRMLKSGMTAEVHIY